MNARQKRSNGGYGLRRKVAKKRLDEDFEYYFSKIGTPWEPRAVKVEGDIGDIGEDMGDDEDDAAKVHARLLLVTDMMKPSSKDGGELPEKRPRGRPKKIQMSIQDREPDISDVNLKFVDLKEKRIRKPKVIYIDDSETSKAVDEICGKEGEIVAIAHEEVVHEEACMAKHLKLEAVLGDGMTGLQEEEVSSLPEGEKENLPEEGVHLDSDSEGTVIVQMGIDMQGESGEADGELYDIGEDIEKSFGSKTKQKYRRNRLSHDTIRKLSQLSPDDKIECNECHKLLKPSSFRQHLRTHTGEKPFGCEVCEARFTRKGDVERHVRIVHNKQKPFKCSRCQRAFGDKKNLRWHILNHNKKLFYVCEVCGFKFGKREYWENHVRFIHPLPGGLDPSEIGDMEGDDRLRALTETLLGEDEAMLDESEDNVASSVIKENSQKEIVLSSNIPSGTIESLPVVNQTAKPSGLKSVNLKCVSSLVKIARPTHSDTGHYIMHNQADGIDAVVIQFNESGVASSTLHSIPQISMKDTQETVSSTNMVRVMNPHQVLEIIQGESSSADRPIVIDTHNYEGGETGTEHAEVLDREDKINVEYIGAENDKMISIMLNENRGGVDVSKSANVQTLIEALLDAAKDDKRPNQITNESI